MIKYSFLSSSSGNSPGPGPAHCEPHPLLFIGPPATLLADPSSMPFPHLTSPPALQTSEIFQNCLNAAVLGLAGLQRQLLWEDARSIHSFSSLLWLTLGAQCHLSHCILLTVHDMIYLGWDLFRVLDCLSSQLHRHIPYIFTILSEVRCCNDTSSSSRK